MLLSFLNFVRCFSLVQIFTVYMAILIEFASLLTRNRSYKAVQKIS